MTKRMTAVQISENPEFPEQITYLSSARSLGVLRLNEFMRNLDCEDLYENEHANKLLTMITSSHSDGWESMKARLFMRFL